MADVHSKELRRKDTESAIVLNKQGWKVITIWECELKPSDRDKKIKSVILEFN